MNGEGAEVRRGGRRPGIVDWAGYLYIAVYLYMIPRFDPLPSSLLTMGTLGMLALLALNGPAYLAVFRGRAKAGLILFLGFTVCMMLIDYLSRGAFSEGVSLFPVVTLCLYMIAGRSVRLQGVSGAKRLTTAYVAALTASMAWFLLTYFSSDLFAFHMRMYKWGIQKYSEELLVLGMRSGLNAYPHLFGYHLVPLTICLFAASRALRGFKRALAVGLTLLAGLTVLLYGERSVFVAIAVGLAVLAKRVEYRRAIFLLGVWIAVALGCLAARQSYQAWQKSEWQADLLSRVRSEQYQSESIDRLRLQLVGLLVCLEYPEGLFLAHKSWTDVVLRRYSALFDAWTRVIAVHNGYLSSTIQYGWGFGFLVLGLLAVLARMAFWLVNHRAPSEGNDYLFPMLGAATCGSLTQALFHNASFATYEPATIVLMALVSVAYCVAPRPAAALQTAGKDEAAQGQGSLGELPLEPAMGLRRQLADGKT